MTQQKWTEDLPGTPILDTIFDAKGDLLSASADDTPAILSVGTNEYNLEAASGETTGLKWASTAKDALILAHLGL